nr:glia maturation factor beta isoform X3 [Caretta caretta]
MTFALATFLVRRPSYLQYWPLSESLVVCDVAEDLVEKLRKFRFRKETNNAAIIMKIDKDKQLVVLDEEHEGISPDELKDELPERQPRFIVYSYKYQHDDGRVSYPLCFIFSSPVDIVQDLWLHSDKTASVVQEEMGIY